jgi:uncharacterized membrane protein HdeD (DUF308 family)
MLDTLARHWWAVALRGVAATLFGLMTLVWPAITLFVLVVLFGAYVLVDGVLALTVAFRRSDRAAALRPGGRGWLIADGIASIIIGVVAFVWPGITAVALLWVIAAWAVVTGALEVVAAVRLRRELRREWLLALSGVFSVLFGILLVVWPAAGALALITLIGVAAIAYGVTLVALGIRLRRRHVPVVVATHHRQAPA